MKPPKEQTKVHKKERHRLRTIFLSAAAVVVVSAAVGLILAAYQPGRYQPRMPENPEIVSPYLTHRLGPDFYNQVQLDEPFELIVDQAGLNDIFSRLEWPMALDGVSVAMPTVHFGPGRITAMARMDFGGLSAVVTVLIRPALDEAGLLNLNIESVRLGALPVTPLAKALAEQLAREYLPEEEGWDAERQMVNAILSNRSFEPVVPVDQYTVRLEGLSIEKGRVRLRLAPVR